MMSKADAWITEGLAEDTAPIQSKDEPKSQVLTDTYMNPPNTDVSDSMVASSLDQSTATFMEEPKLRSSSMFMEQDISLL